MIKTERHDAVSLISLDRDVTNALSFALIEELTQALVATVSDETTRAIVLTSSNEKFFSIGFDIPELFELDEPEMLRFYRAANDLFLQLYSCERPTVAALTGHAIAGGCILALCCDRRVSAAGRKLMGLNEIKLGVPVPYLANRIVCELAGVGPARDLLELGEFHEAARSRELGLVDQIVPLEETRSAALDLAAKLGAMPSQAYATIKQHRIERVTQQFKKGRKARERAFIDCWFSDEARTRLAAAKQTF